MSPWWKKPTEEAMADAGFETIDRREEAAPPLPTPDDQPQSSIEPELETTKPDLEARVEGPITAADQIADAIADAPEGEEEAPKPRPRRRPRRRSPATRTDDMNGDEKQADAGSDTSSTDQPDDTSAAKGTPARAPAKKTAAKRKAPAKKATARKRAPARKEPAARAEPKTREPAPERPSSPVPRPLIADSDSSIAQLAEAIREAFTAAPARSGEDADERKIALFCDLENIALGVRDSDVKKFDIDLVLERLLEKGKIIVKKAYADWQRYSEFKKPLHSSGIELIDIPQKYYSGKNSADIKMVVDALEMSFSKEHLDTFVLLSGDSDFTPLVHKLKENNKHVICVGVKSSSSKLLIDNCDEFIYYEDIWRDSQQAPKLEGLDEKAEEIFLLMNDAIQALLRENKTVLWGSMVKQTMQRKRPSFNEGYYGYRTFSDVLEDAERKGILHLKKDTRSGSYIIAGLGPQST